MNILKPYLSLVILLLALVSCSSDNDDNPPVDTNVSGNNFPLTIDNYWNYDVFNTNLDTNETVTGRDSLYVASSAGNTFTLSTDGIADGTMNSILTQSALQKTASTLLGSGTIAFPFDGLNDIEIEITNAVFYDLNANTGTVLYEVDGTIEQTVEALPVVATYNLTTTQREFSESINLNGETYTNVTKSSIDLSLVITTTIEVLGNPVTVTVLADQNVLHIDNYYAENIGLVRSEANIMYQLEDFSTIGITLPFPDELNANSIQELDTYMVADE